MLASLVIPVGVSSTSEIIRGPISAEVLRVMDGDTIVVRARIWLGQDIETRVRLDGVDTPEINGKCERERRMALKARDWVVSLAAGGKAILRDIQYGKYAGRVVARVEALDGEDFSHSLLRAGLGRPYDGRRRGWCETPRSAAFPRQPLKSNAGP